MGSVSGDETPGGPTAPGASLTDADRALLLASVAWGDRHWNSRGTTGPDAGAPDFLEGVRDRLAPAWLRLLRDALDRDVSLAASDDPSKALDELASMHRAMSRVDLTRVHPSWLVRALREESPAVRRAVASALTGSLRHQVQAGLLLDSEDLLSERAAAAEVVPWVMALWTERLVGGEAERANDPPAIIVLARLPLRAGYCLCRMAGLCKLILADQPQRGRPGETERARHEWLAGRLADADGDLRTRAKRDVESGRSSRLPLRHQAARIGLAAIARLLAECEPFRLRWALQHWPYPIAKLIRALMPPVTNRSSALFESETWILKTAWDRLNLERRLPLAWPES
jgi:hypothetical protein